MGDCGSNLHRILTRRPNWLDEAGQLLWALDVAAILRSAK